MEDIGDGIGQREAFRSYAEQIFEKRELIIPAQRREDDPDVYQYEWSGYKILEKYMDLFNQNSDAASLPWTSEIRILDPRH